MRVLFTVTMLLCALVLAAGSASAGSCVDCHGNAAAMAKQGYPQFTVGLMDTLTQSGMPAQCEDCHLGDPQKQSKEDAHAGMITVMAVNRQWKALTRPQMPEQDAKGWPSLEPRGDNRATQLAPKQMIDGEVENNRDYRAIVWHDKNPETLAFNPSIAMKTCGKCHARHVQDFQKTSMGGAHGAHTQSQYVYWTGPLGPQSCGLWTGDMTRPDQDEFTDKNIKTFNQHSTMHVPVEAGYNLQRNCNRCHVGCLDCHYRPQAKTTSPRMGAHTFVRKPEPLSCYGGGRAFACHAGPMDRRRGDGYLRAEFTQATEAGKKILKDHSDVHLRKGIVCVDCHRPNAKTGLHGDLQRNVNCGTCHDKTTKAQGTSIHKKLDCTACHTPLIGGYAFNFWTVGGEDGIENPLVRIQDYLVDAIAPVLVKNPKGQWVPVHPVPHTSGNVKADEVKISKKLMFRNRPDVPIDRRYFSNDSFAITGLVKQLDEQDHDVMVWINLDRVAHGIGKSRTCESCHASTSQRVFTNFSMGSYKDVEDGSYTIIADDKGLRITEFKGPDGGPPAKGLEPFKDKWVLKGDFSLPKIKDRTLYEKLKKEHEAGKFAH
ncbi:MAG TPA: hypothetical protein DCS42_14040 [Nitrospiraceae bacterium]|nr:hypothetical protein [Nitrospiraceae bacterium]HAS55149.1 hypothetical protein [Nitrospiraceae bacterium]